MRTLTGYMRTLTGDRWTLKGYMRTLTGDRWTIKGDR